MLVMVARDRLLADYVALTHLGMCADRASGSIGPSFT